MARFVIKKCEDDQLGGAFLGLAYRPASMTSDYILDSRILSIDDVNRR
jgi:hypothetical protein